MGVLKKKIRQLNFTSDVIVRLLIKNLPTQLFGILVPETAFTTHLPIIAKKQQYTQGNNALVRYKEKLRESWDNNEHTQQTFPYRADIGSMSEYRCRFPISDRCRADIYNCTVKYFFKFLSIQQIINVNPFSLLYC